MVRHALLVSALLALLAVPAGATHPQQERMKACNAEVASRGLGGEARRVFLKNCLAGRIELVPPAPKAPTPQQLRMKTCNADASARKLMGDARRSFLAGCLRGE
jgi:hypothetical protein